MDASGSGGGVNVYEHGTVVDKKRGRVACNYCGKVVSGSFRLKCHVGGIRGDVLPCQSAPADVIDMMKNMLMERKREKIGMDFRDLLNPDLPWKKNCSPNSCGGKRKMPETAQTSGSLNGSQEEMDFSIEDGETGNVLAANGSRGSKRGANKEPKTDVVSRQVQKCIGRFFFETGLEFAAANSPSFKRMINCTLGAGQAEFRIPSYEELRGWILEDEVKEMQEYVEKIRQSWAATGCSILLDGWVDEKGRTLVNFLVNCPQGPIYLCSHDISSFVGDTDAIYSLLDGVIKDVGVGNVVQVVANSTTGWAGTVGEDFSNRHKGVFWAVSASHCIELILEKIGMLNSIREILDKAKVITKFIHGHETVLNILKKHTRGRGLIQLSKIKSAMPFMTLEKIVSEKKKLEDMFSSYEWNMSIWASRAEGKRVADLVEDHSFWTGAGTVLKAAMPLVRILDWIFEADKPLVGYIYETMDQVKETIKDQFKGKRSSQYMPFWEVIDKVWDNILHSPLHGAGYYLNPSLFYSSDFYGDDEVAFGLLCCLVQMVQHQPTQDMISRQFDQYRHAKGSFQEGKAKNRRTSIPPAMWWSCYGQECPDLQSFAIRILSQNCDGASKYGLKRTLAEKLLTTGRNPIEQQRLKGLTFVHYNLHLQQFRSGVKSGIAAEEIDPMDDWIIDEAPDIVFQNADSSWMNLDHTQGAMNEEGPSRVEGKAEPM